MTTAEVFAPAKINLTLHVTGLRADGYHLLDSLVVFVDIGDRLWLTPGAETTLTVTGPFAEGVPADRRNLVWQAVDLAGWTGDIVLEKNLPHGAGIGGGSADAAAALRGVFGADVAGRLGTRAVVSLGADVPVCLTDQPKRMRGIGDVLEPVARLPEAHVVLVNPNVVLPTPEVFAALADKNNPPMPEGLPELRDAAAMARWLGDQRNDLFAPAVGRCPVLSDVVAALQRHGAKFAAMSGSGPTCFGLFSGPDAARIARDGIAADQPDWWVAAGAISRGKPARD